jgi:hypothetical protein
MIMLRNLRVKILFFFVIAAIFSYLDSAGAGSDRASGGGACSVDLDFRIQIQTILFLQLGDRESAVESIEFVVSDLPGTGAVSGSSSGGSSVPVKATAVVPPGQIINLLADSSTALTSGINTIRFDEVSWTATGDFMGNVFDNEVSQQLDQFKGSGSRCGKYEFYYNNDTYYPAGTYTGTVTYTLSSP